MCVPSLQPLGISCPLDMHMSVQETFEMTVRLFPVVYFTGSLWRWMRQVHLGEGCLAISHILTDGGQVLSHHGGNWPGSQCQCGCVHTHDIQEGRWAVRF